jgi:hypothetical protein
MLNDLATGTTSNNPRELSATSQINRARLSQKKKIKEEIPQTTVIHKISVQKL